LDPDVSGSTFFHRTLATRFLIERQIAGQHVAGEYLILRRKLTFPIEALTRKIRKLPDGFCWSRMADGSMGVEFVEQEASAKARAELEKCLRAAELHGHRLDSPGKYRVAGLVFVFDRELNHAHRILLAATSLRGSKSNGERIALERRVKLVSVELRDPLLWVSSKVTTLHDLRALHIPVNSTSHSNLPWPLAKWEFGCTRIGHITMYELFDSWSSKVTLFEISADAS
jgi:hypothetical protein